MERNSGLSVVIPAYNEENFLPETLSYLLSAQQRFQSQFGLPSELIVVDNVSTDRTAEVAKRLGARVVRHEIRNIASVRNAGIAAASYSICITVDADTYVPADAFVKIWSKMLTGQFIGGATRLGIRTRKLRLKLFIKVTEWLTVKLTGLGGGMFFFSHEAAEAIGGFPESLLIAEDLTFAKNLKNFGKTHGKAFCNLRSVAIETFDRKDVSFFRILDSLWKGVRMFFGAKLSREELGYWYNPKR